MKATEFVKKFGIVRAKQILDHAPEGAASFDFIGIKYSNGSRLVGKKHIGLNHLKRLVESHELVEILEGLGNAKSIVENKPKGATRYLRGYYLKEARYIYEYSIHLKVWRQNGRHKEWSAMWNGSSSIRELKQAIADFEACKEVS